MYDLVSSSIIIINSKERFKELLQDTCIKNVWYYCQENFIDG